MYKLGTPVVNVFAIGETSETFVEADHRIRIISPSGQNVELDDTVGRVIVAPTATTPGSITTAFTLDEEGIWKIEYIWLFSAEPRIVFTNYLHVVAPTTLVKCSPIDKAAYAL